MGEMTKWSEEEKQTWAVSKLLEKQKELGRLPHKDDFDVVTLSRIKAFLGTWPHALVKAGLKEAKPTPPKKKKRSRSAGTAHETEPFRLAFSVGTAKTENICIKSPGKEQSNQK